MAKIKITKTTLIQSVLFALLAFGPIAEAFAKSDCMKMGWRRGKPFDYYAAETRQSTGTYRGGLLYLVESAHFTKKVRRLIEGSTSKQPGDLLFVLGSIPNHPVALDAYARYEYQWENSRSFKASLNTDEPKYDAGCFFERAAKIYPGQASTYLTWGIYYYRRGEHQKALEKFLEADKLSPGSAEAKYNVGLAYAEVNDLANAKKYAEAAYKLGYPLPGLKMKIAELEKAQNN
ncbi:MULTISPECIES: tetratricopeptide repeat protein [Alteromonadaceae]|uniref:tetratricopeptide repeat protein n=1 Tax=Alteromonadaceae TaxID=72275 RepID=UPI001C0833D9|nr:hypothetical protein [Aliiglaciecola lipolytica]MBU2877821.1 hypothetical protein [Aliiglaciecola lipolytica]